MKTVIKCDFCIRTVDIDKANEMFSHEKDCFLNPAVKNCYTCKNYKDIGSTMTGEIPHCNSGECASDILYGDNKCEKHVSKVT